MITPLYPTFQKSIDDAFDDLQKEQVEPWAMLNSGKPLRVKYFNGKQISYERIGFDGSPEKVFWSRYIEPYMEEIILREINEASRLAEEKLVDATILLKEVESLLLSKVRATYLRMATIDRNLKGKGFPERVKVRPIEGEYDEMKKFIELRIRAEQELWRRSKLNRWVKNNPFYIWLIGTVVAVIGLYAVFN